MRQIRWATAVLLALTVAIAGGASPTGASTLPSNFTDTLVASVSGPTGLAFTPDGRLLVAAQYGQIRVVQAGSLLAAPALDLASVICNSEEQGVLGVAVDPAFSSNGFIYVYYTKSDPGNVCVNRVSRFTMSGNTATLSSELVLLDEIPSPGYHNGGDLHFGKDGYLYVSVGDGGCDYDYDTNCASSNAAARDQNVLLGKVLRITSTGGIPPTNPFQGAGTDRCSMTGETTPGTKCQETFAWGLRNPFRLAFDPNAAGTRFYINDVGQDTWEEIDAGTAGADYGWNVREGPCATDSTTDCGAPPAGMTNPVYSYSHAESTCHAITGGAFVPNGTWPSSYDGTYLYGDYTCDEIFLLTPNGSSFTRSEFATDVGPVVNLVFGPSAQGQSLYYTNYSNGGEIHRIDYVGAGNRPPTASLSTTSPRAGPLPLAVSFDGSASSDPDPGDTLSYTWNFGDGSSPVTTTSATTSHTYTAAGSFTASLVVTDNHGAASAPVTVRVDPGDAPPQVQIDSPTVSTRFAVGQTITLHGTATDPEDGALPASSLTWVVIKHHDTHTHPFLAPTSGNDIPITGPPPEDLLGATNSYLEIQLTATDSKGVSTTITQNLLPHKVDLTFSTNPAGLNVELNGLSYPTTTTVTSWEGWGLPVNAPTQTDGTARTWAFQSWSDGGAASHTVTTPAVPATYTATFAQTGPPPGLVGAWSFNEGSGSSAADSSGSGNAGTVAGAAWSTAGKYGGALSFSGANNWVTVNDSNSLDLTGAMTLEGWVKPSASGTNWRCVLFKERPGGMVYALYANQDTNRPVGQTWIGGEWSAVGSAALPLNAWSHLASTYDGSALRLYVNGSLVVTTPVSGVMTPSTGVLHIGGDSVWGEWFAGLIDEVRIYNRALSQGEIQADMNAPIGATAPPPADTSPPSAPSGLTAATSAGQAALSWAAATDNVGVTRYDVYRSVTPNFTPSSANRIAQPTTTTYTDSGLAAGTYYYRVTAEDAAGNVGASSNEVTAVIPADQPPTVSITAPASGATVSGTVTVSANAADDVAVAGVQFKLDGANLGTEDTTSPYSVSWDTKTASNGSHTLTAVARDGAAHTTTSASVAVTVNNAAPPDTTPPSTPSGLTAATSVGQSALSWTAATDNVGVARYNVHRATTQNFTPSAANRVAQPTTTAYTDTGLAAGTYYYRVTAEDAAGNVSAPSSAVKAVVPADQPPTVSITAPASGSTVSGTVTVSASAADDVAVAGVQFKLDGANLGAEDTSSPYSVSWDTKTAASGSHSLTAVARDSAAHTTTSTAVSVTVNNGAPPPVSGLVAAYGLNSSAADSSGLGNAGTVSGATWSTAGKYGGALSFNGVNNWMTVNDSNSLDLSSAMTLEAWVRPSALGGMWRTVVFKERPGGMVYTLYAGQDTSRPIGQVFIGSERNVIGTASLPLNTWSHLAVTYDGANLRLYVNGALVSTTAVTGSMAASTGVLRLGGNSVWSEWYAGLIDEVRLYSRALSQSEIQTDMNTPIG